MLMYVYDVFFVNIYYAFIKVFYCFMLRWKCFWVTGKIQQNIIQVNYAWNRSVLVERTESNCVYQVEIIQGSD